MPHVSPVHRFRRNLSTLLSKTCGVVLLIISRAPREFFLYLSSSFSLNYCFQEYLRPPDRRNEQKANICLLFIVTYIARCGLRSELLHFSMCERHPLHPLLQLCSQKYWVTGFLQSCLKSPFPWTVVAGCCAPVLVSSVCCAHCPLVNCDSELGGWVGVLWGVMTSVASCRLAQCL